MNHSPCSNSAQVSPSSRCIFPHHQAASSVCQCLTGCSSQHWLQVKRCLVEPAVRIRVEVRQCWRVSSFCFQDRSPKACHHGNTTAPRHTPTMHCTTKRHHTWALGFSVYAYTVIRGSFCSLVLKNPCPKIFLTSRLFTPELCSDVIKMSSIWSLMSLRSLSLPFTVAVTHDEEEGGRNVKEFSSLLLRLMNHCAHCCASPSHSFN